MIYLIGICCNFEVSIIGVKLYIFRIMLVRLLNPTLTSDGTDIIKKSVSIYFLNILND